jgi:type IV pilus assembly protein PilC
MPVFEYEVADPRGVLSRGRAEAESQGALILRFREQGRLVVGVRTVERAGRAEGLSALADGLKASFGEVGRRVGLETLLLFTGQLAAMLAGGLHLARILSALASETTNKRFRRVLDDVRETITAGSSFADALGLHPHIFDRLYVAVIRAGELSGSLPVVLDALTIYLEKSAHLRRKVLGAITYPLVILAVAASMVFAMIVFLVPVFEGVYARANTALPAPTRLLIAVSGVIRGYTLVVIAGAVAAAALLYGGAQTARGRRLIDGAKLRVPLFGPLVRKAVLARTCRTLSVLLSSGIPLIEAMATVARVSGIVASIASDTSDRAGRRRRARGVGSSLTRRQGRRAYETSLGAATFASATSRAASVSRPPSRLRQRTSISACDDWRRAFLHSSRSREISSCHAAFEANLGCSAFKTSPSEVSLRRTSAAPP